MGSTHIGDTQYVMRPPIIYHANSVREFPGVSWMAVDPSKLADSEAYLMNQKGPRNSHVLKSRVGGQQVYLCLTTIVHGLKYAEVRNFDDRMPAKHFMELSILSDKLELQSPKILEGFLVGDGFTLEALSEECDGCMSHCRKAIGLGQEIVVVKYSLLKSSRGGKCSFSYRQTKCEETERPIYRSVELKIDNIDDLRGNKTATRMVFGRQLPTGKDTYATDSFEFVFGSDAKLEKVIGLSQSNCYNNDWNSVRMQGAMRKGSGIPVEHTPDWRITSWLLREFLGETDVSRRCQPASILASLMDSAIKGSAVIIDHRLIFG